MDVIKDLAKNFKAASAQYYSLEAYDSALNSKLIYINKPAEKVRFLGYLKELIEEDYQKHVKVCTHKPPETCPRNRDFEMALYSVKQQFDDYSEIAGLTSNAERPSMHFFPEGKYFDAFTALRSVIKEATISIILIDNYVDADTLALFDSKEPSITFRVITAKRSLTDHFKRAVDVYNKEFENLKIGLSEQYHDRFLVLDNSQFYHIGASLKDAGNKTFMFTKIEDRDIQQAIQSKIDSEWLQAHP